METTNGSGKIALNIMFMNPCTLLMLKFIATKIQLFRSMGAFNIVDFTFESLCYQPQYCQTRMAWNFKYFLDLCQELKITINIATIAPHKRGKLSPQIDNPLLEKALNGNLDLADLYVLADENKRLDSRDSIIFNLFLVIDILNIPDNALDILQNKIRQILERFLTEKEIPGEFDRNLYTFNYQKRNCLKALSPLYQKLGSKFWLSNIDNALIFGEESSKVRSLETVLGLELEDYLTITKISLQNKYVKKIQTYVQILALFVEINIDKIPREEAFPKIKDLPEKLLTIIPANNKKYLTIRKMAIILLSNSHPQSEINFYLAKCLSRKSRLTKAEYIQNVDKKINKNIKEHDNTLNKQIKNRFKILNKIWRKLGYQAKFSHSKGSSIVKIQPNHTVLAE